MPLVSITTKKKKKNSRVHQCILTHSWSHNTFTRIYKHYHTAIHSNRTFRSSGATDSNFRYLQCTQSREHNSVRPLHLSLALSRITAIKMHQIHVKCIYASHTTHSYCQTLSMFSHPHRAKCVHLAVNRCIYQICRRCTKV